MPKIPLNALFDYIEMMKRDLWGYIFGKAGIIWTKQMQAMTSKGSTECEYGGQWIGHYVADCSGVPVYIWKQFGLKIEHSSNAIARKYVGAMLTTPKPGYAAFKWRKDTAPDRWKADGKGDFYHIGIVGRDGKTVYESSNTKDGFITTKTSKWNYFAPFKDVEYAANTTPATPTDLNKEEIPMNKATVTADKVNVRTRPDKKSPRVTYVNKGNTVDILDEQNGWYQVKTSFGDVGWVYGQFLAPEGESIVDGEEEAIEVTFSMFMTKPEIEAAIAELQSALAKFGRG